MESPAPRAATRLRRAAQHLLPRHAGAVFTPGPLRKGAVVVPLHPPTSPLLDASRLHEPEAFNHRNGLSSEAIQAGERAPYDGSPIRTVTGIHNPTLEAHLLPADAPGNTGAAIVVIPGGGHQVVVVEVRPTHPPHISPVTPA